ncbi:MAG: hypothetical protein H6767_07945 [Candidatus Peribacteria bacterium]|nr:MAG: hypothetical protein H6767_07945 [Candidatus Peribacteria bacterium]
MDPTQADPFEVYCDMTADDGGWTLVEKTHNGSTTLHKTVAALNSVYLQSDNYDLVSKFSDDMINLIRGNYSESIFKIQALDATEDYFKEDKVFDMLAYSGSINQTYDTYRDVVLEQDVCSGTHNPTYHTGLVGWGCGDSFLLSDALGSRNATYQAVRVRVK